MAKAAGSSLRSDGAPDGLGAVLTVIEFQRQGIDRSARAAIDEVKALRDEQLSRLDRVVAVLRGEGIPVSVADSGEEGGECPSTRRRRRPRSKHGTSRAAARERREAVYRHLVEEGGTVAPGQISRSLRISSRAARTALTRLREEGRAKRTGTGTTTRYEAEGGAGGLTPAERPGNSTDHGTLQGRVLATIQDRGWATLDELIQATRASSEQVLTVCGALTAEEEIEMDRRDGRGVYVVRGGG